jgi:hypothetical protein
MNFRPTLLVLFAIFLLSSLAFANDPPLQPTSPLLQALESATQMQVPLSIPQPIWNATCSAQQWCPVTLCLVLCNGQNSCTVQTNSVTCDGNVTNCPSCPTPPPNCFDPCEWCQCRANGFTAFQCRESCWES